MPAATQLGADHRRDVLPVLLMLLTLTTGIVDAVSVIGLGGVFVALMTGNTLFLGFALAGAPAFEATHNATALAAFIVGAAIAGRIALAFAESTRRRWLMTVAGCEFALLFVAGLLASGYDMQHLEPKPIFYSVIVLTAAAMGVRSATVKKLGVADVTTTVLTLTFASLASDVTQGVQQNAGRRLGSIVCLLTGAIVGALLVLHAGVSVALLVSAVTVFTGTAAHALHPSSRTRAKPQTKQ